MLVCETDGQRQTDKQTYINRQIQTQTDRDGDSDREEEADTKEDNCEEPRRSAPVISAGYIFFRANRQLHA